MISAGVLQGIRALGRRTFLLGAGTASAGGAAALAGCGPALPAGRATASAAAVVSSMPSAVAPAAALASQTVKVTIEVNKHALVDQLHAYFSDPSPESRRQREVFTDFSSPKKLSLPPQLLEALVLEGDLTRDDVEEFVDGLLGGYENLVIH